MSAVLDSEFCRLLDIRLLRSDREGVELEFAPADAHRNHGGAIAGGAVMTLLDAAGGAAARSHLGEDCAPIATTDMTTQFWNAATVGERLVCRAQLVHRSGRSMRIEATARCAERTIAKAFMTYVIVRKG
jgi:uncharacterized protein (TIGR00369 family)